VRLGDTALGNMTALPPEVFAQPDLQLRLWFNDGVNGFAALDPAQPLTATPYARNAANLSGTVAANQIIGALSSNNIDAGSITAIMLATGAVGTNQLDPTIGVWTSAGSNIFRPQGNVGIGTATPTAGLSLGDNQAAGKLLVFDNGVGGGAGLGFTNSEFRLFLPSTGNRFAFQDAVNGNELLTIIGSSRNVGIGTNSPQVKLHVVGSIRLGTSGDLLAPGGVENLRILRGRISGSGGITTGTGFTVAKTGTGAYTVTFTVPFAGQPTVTATPQVSLARIATCSSVLLGSAQFWTFDSAGGAAIDQDFHFIAIGPR
jgi:hypothetical protein